MLAAVTGLPHHLCTILSGLIKAVISIPGGLKSVVNADVLQTIILLCGFGFLTYSVLAASGGLTGLLHRVPADYHSFLGIKSLGGGKVLILVVVLVFGVVADPGRRSRVDRAVGRVIAERCHQRVEDRGLVPWEEVDGSPVRGEADRALLVRARPLGRRSPEPGAKPGPSGACSPPVSP